MASRLPNSIKKKFQDSWKSETWHKYTSADDKEIFLLVRRSTDGKCSWGVYLDDSGIRKPVLTSGIHENPDKADTEWFQSWLRLD